MNLTSPKRRLRRSGFTLTEVLVVVLVISVLAAIAYPIYTKSANKSRAVEAINLLQMVRTKQLAKFARSKQYITDVSALGQLTSHKSTETVVDGQVLKIKDYTISLNPSKDCSTATYDKGGIKFSFSSSYEHSGLGCTGAICSSFGNIIGASEDVCGCSSAPCPAGFVRDTNNCECKCLSGCINNGVCQAPSQTQPTSRACGNGGTQLRTCTAGCDGGSCGEWGPCTGQSCPASSKPAESEVCGNCGTRTRTVTCDGATGAWTSGAWGNCTAEGVCAPNATQPCGNGGTQTCTSSCQWSSTCVETPCPATCADGFIRTSATTGNTATCCSCPSPKTTKMQSGGCDVNGNCQANKMICTCPNTADYTKCTSTGGTWNDTTCTCTCPTTGKNPFDSTTGCACPSGKEWRNWRYTSGPGAGPAAKQCICSNAIDYSAFAGGSCSNSVSTSNDMEAKCKGLFCIEGGSYNRFVMASGVPDGHYLKYEADRTAAGTWNGDSCSCSCPSGGTLRNGRCFMCETPLTWNGSSCACQLNCSMGYGQLDNYPYNTNAVRASTGCNCVCPQGWTWGYHGVTHLGQQVQTCAPTSTCSGPSTQACGNCNSGTQTRQCVNLNGVNQWSDWGPCVGETGCAPGSKKLVHCGRNTGYNPTGKEEFIYREVTCTNSCTWPTVAPCNNCVEHPYCGKTFANGTTGPCYCIADEPIRSCSWNFVSGYICVDQSDPGDTRTRPCGEPCPLTCDTPGETVTCLQRVSHMATLRCVC